MLGIENLKPIEWTNSLLNPLGFQISNRKQIISKIALATLAALTIYNALPVVEGLNQFERERYCNRFMRAILRCRRDCRRSIDTARYNGMSLLRGCLNACLAHGDGYTCDYSRFILRDPGRR